MPFNNTYITFTYQSELIHEKEKYTCILGTQSTTGCKIQDIIRSISIRVKFEEMTDDEDDDEDESDKHLDSRRT